MDASVAKSMAIDEQRKKNLTPTDRKETATSGKRGNVTPSSIKTPINRNTYTISETQQIQLMTPCRVVVQNIKNSLKEAKESDNLRTNSPSRSLSPRSPVVVLDRITRRKKNKRASSVSDSDEHSAAELDIDMLALEEIKNETIKFNEIDPFKVDLDITYCVPQVRVTCPEDSKKSEENVFNSSPGDLDVTLTNKTPVKDKISPPKKSIKTASNKVSPSAESQASAAIKSTDGGTPQHNIKQQLKVKSASKLKSPSENHLKSGKSPSKTNFVPDELDSDKDSKVKSSKKKRDSDPDFIPDQKVVINHKKRTIRKNRPMPLCKKVLLRKEMDADTSEEDDMTSPAKRFSYESKIGNPDPKPHTESDQDSESSVTSNKKRLDSSYQDYSQDSDASFSSNCSMLSPDERRAYMKTFLDRVRNEDPLEGTSRKFEPKKKTPSGKPSKKSLRIREKKVAYTESPETPSKPNDADESWRPPQRKRPRPLSKKND